MEKIKIVRDKSWIRVSGFGMRVWYPRNRYTTYAAVKYFRREFENF